MLYPLLAAVIDSFALVFAKRFLNIFKKLSAPAFAFWVLLFIILVGLATLPWTGHIDRAALSWPYLLLAIAMAALAANYNLLYYYTLKREQVARIEPFLLFNPLVTIAIASLIYADERVWQIYLAAGLAGALLLWSRWQRSGFQWGLAMWAMVGFAILYGIEVAIIRQLLTVYSPVALYLVRSVVTILFLWVLERGRFPSITWRQALYLLALAGSAVLVAGLVYTSYHLRGVGQTVVVLILSPVLVYLLSAAVLKEKLLSRDIVASVGVVALVLWASLWR